MPTTVRPAAAPRRAADRAAGLARRAFRKAVFRQARMDRYEVRAGDSTALGTACPYPVAVLSGRECSAVAGTNPYLSESDLTELLGRGARCVVVRDGGRVVASAWMTSGVVRVHELERTIVVPAGEHFACRIHVDPAYRGRSLMTHMLCAYAAAVPPDDVLWALVYPWNVASARSFEAAGWRRTGRYWTRVVLTRRLSGVRRAGPAGG